jgi:hypothetical protein
MLVFAGTIDRCLPRHAECGQHHRVGSLGSENTAIGAGKWALSSLFRAVDGADG